MGGKHPYGRVVVISFSPRFALSRREEGKICVWECRAVLVYGKRANADRKHKKKTGKMPVFYIILSFVGA